MFEGTAAVAVQLNIRRAEVTEIVIGLIGQFMEKRRASGEGQSPRMGKN